MNKTKNWQEVFFDFNIDDITISKKETACIYYMMLGMTAKQISRKLHQSFRTIEGYIVNIKMKLNCNDRVEIITKVLKNKFPVERFFGELNEVLECKFNG